MEIGFETRRVVGTVSDFHFACKASKFPPENQVETNAP